MITDLQKASLSKRIAAGLLDVMLLLVVVVGFAALLTWLFGYESHGIAMNQRTTFYESQYDVDLSISQEEYTAMTEAQRKHFDEAWAARGQDEQWAYHFNMVVSLTLLITTFSILLGLVLLEVIVPLLLKNGQTIGKKAFALGVMRVDAVQITPLQLVVRTVLGKFTIETMISVYLIIMIFFQMVGMTGPLVILGLLVTQLICMIATKTNSMIHDLLAGTVVVDISSQKIFRTTTDLIDYQKKIAAERAARQQY